MSTATQTMTAVAFPPAGCVAGTWTIDPAHTTVGFAVRHLMGRVRGTFDGVAGEIVTGVAPSRCTVAVTVEMSSVRTGNQMRDEHLRSADFLDVEHSPVMTFASTGLRVVGDGYVLDGDLTIRGCARPVQLDVEFLGVDPTGLQGETRIGFAAHGVIHRHDFGVSFGLAADAPKIVVSDRVEISIDVQAFASDGLPG